ncbi:cobyric acid synthase [Edwardsiella piscicida]|nr:cobyric acid synthase [Edwardsiella piscicida]
MPHFYQDGLRTAPFKSQNMALNSGITPDGKEMGRAQIFQAQAAGIAPDVRMNPVLLKPTSDRKAQVVLMGRWRPIWTPSATTSTSRVCASAFWRSTRAWRSSMRRWCWRGRQSGGDQPARSRYRQHGDGRNGALPGDPGGGYRQRGVFASIYGTLALLRQGERARVKGVIINKFRGDVALLHSGIEQIEALTGVPVLGVMPWLEVDLDDEDGVALQKGKYRQTAPRDIDIAVVQIPHISNFTDVNALAAQPDVRVRYVSHPQALAGADLVILPGSKNTLGDLAWLRESGMADALLQAHRQRVPLIGICGGYQMLGSTIIDEVESGLGTQPGLGLLHIVTRFAPRKTTALAAAQVTMTPPAWLHAAAGVALKGYEIHMGETQRAAGCRPALFIERNGERVADGAISDDGLVIGTYLHGLFDSDAFTHALVDSLRHRKGLAPRQRTLDYAAYKAQQIDTLASAMREHIDIKAIYKIMREHRRRRHDFSDRRCAQRKERARRAAGGSALRAHSVYCDRQRHR